MKIKNWAMFSLPALSKKIPLLIAGVLFVCGCERSAEANLGGEADVEMQEKITEKSIYVSINGNDQADGTEKNPLKTVAQAIQRLNDEGGVILLLPGVYTEDVELKASSATAPLRITALESDTVIFDGGQAVGELKNFPEFSGLYVAEPKSNRPAFAGEAPYVEIWDPERRVRYRRMMDSKGVAAYPDSFCLLGDGSVLLHLEAKGQNAPPKLYRNRSPLGFSIARPNTTLQGVILSNYNGGRNARAIAIRANNVVVDGCTIENSTTGVTVATEIRDAVVRNCTLLDVGNGITSHGIGTRVEDCLILSAEGDFSVNTLSHARRNGVRIYHPAEGAHVSGSLTNGFWCGLRIKTKDHSETSPPVTIVNNTFLDGLRFASGVLKSSKFERNLIGRNEDGVSAVSELKTVQANFENNYIFDGSKLDPADQSNAVGKPPFMNPDAGDLSLQAGLIPKEIIKEGGIGAAFQKVDRRLLVRTAPQAAEDGVVRVMGDPIIASSQYGAAVSLPVSRAVKGVLRYRKAGNTEWKLKPLVPVSAAGNGESFVSVALSDTEVVPNQEYEFEIALTNVQPAISGSFFTRGEPAVIEIAPSSTGELQKLLLKTLPGDVVRLSPGVQTGALVLVHGGTPNNPVVLEGSGPSATLFDGGKQVETMLSMQNVNNLHIKGITFRWFNENGIKMENCSNVQVTDCYFLNAEPKSTDGKEGYGLFIEKSSNVQVSHCLFVQLIYGLIAIDSSELIIKNNTAFLNMYSSIHLINSSLNSQVMFNSFTFTGNISMRISEKDPEAFKSLISDFNNFGTVIGDVSYYRSIVGKNEQINVEVGFEPTAHYGRVGSSKRIIDASVGSDDRKRFFRMQDWREYSGKDANSIFADPLYVDPLKLDFRLLPESKNSLGDGRYIGANNLK